MPDYCGAKKRDGGKCKQPAMKNGRCRLHGGKSLAGIASPTFKTGQHSKYLTALPGRLRESFEALRTRDDLLLLSNEIGLIDARLLDVLARTDQGEAGQLWRDLHKAHQAFKTARAAGNVQQMTERLAEMEQVIERGVSDWQAWGEVKSLVEQRRKLVESERKREVEQQEMLTGREAAMLFNALLSIVNEHVTDRDTKQRIQTAVTGLVDADVRGGLKLVG